MHKNIKIDLFMRLYIFVILNLLHLNFIIEYIE